MSEIKNKEEGVSLNTLVIMLLAQSLGKEQSGVVNKTFTMKESVLISALKSEQHKERDR